MRIRMLEQMPPGALRNGQPWPAKGKTEDVLTGEALHLVASGIAESVQAPRRSKARKEDT
ncbi:hypothetical protein AB0M87_02650 [Streptomyces sp. NPDC051320]|uniref:hypothetical protein n=1 Tax=Streptomyces sp. NPDC051320 TaxID=3154644 RepID=UPI003440757C